MDKFKLFHFLGEKSGEDLVLVVRRHWFNILAQFILILLFLFGLLLVHLFLPALFPDLAENGEIRSLFIFVENLFILGTWLVSFLIFLDYYLDVWIITSKRVVNVEQKGLFSRQVSELKIENIQDITTEVHGLIPTFLNFGDVFVQTAAEQERFRFRQVGDPYRIKDTLMNLQKLERRKNAEELAQIIDGKK